MPNECVLNPFLMWYNHSFIWLECRDKQSIPFKLFLRNSCRYSKSGCHHHFEFARKQKYMLLLLFFCYFAKVVANFASHKIFSLINEKRKKRERKKKDSTKAYIYTCDELPNTAYLHKLSHNFYSRCEPTSNTNHGRNKIQYASRIHLNANQKEFGCGLFMLFYQKKKRKERKKSTKKKEKWEKDLYYGSFREGETEWHGNCTQWKRVDGKHTHVYILDCTTSYLNSKRKFTWYKKNPQIRTYQSNKKAQNRVNKIIKS